MDHDMILAEYCKLQHCDLTQLHLTECSPLLPRSSSLKVLAQLKGKKMYMKRKNNKDVVEQNKREILTWDLQ